MTIAVNSHLMAFSNVAHLPLAEKLKATRVAGCSGLSLMPYELDQMEAAGLSPESVRRQTEDEGLKIVRLDPLNTWPRVWLPDNMDDAYIATVDTRKERVFDLCSRLGCTHLSLNATFPKNALTIEQITEDYARICTDAAEFGLTVDLEFIPLWGVPTLDMAWKIVSGSGAKNGGLVFDTWHFVRGKSRMEDLKAIPGSWIHCVQLNDGPLELPPGVSIKDNCYDRKFPGDGEFPNAEIVNVLAQSGGLNQLGAEVFSPILKTMTAEQVGLISRDSIHGILVAAGIANAA